MKFTSRNFQIEIELKQAMIVSPDPFLDECFIRKPINKQTNKVIIEEKEKEKENNNDETDLEDLINKSALNILQKKEEPINLEVFSEKEEPKEKEKEKEETILLDIEELNAEPIEETNDELKEIDPMNQIDNNLETITLKKPNQVYYEIYKKAREKAKEAKKSALIAYLEMKNIKKTYMLNDIDESDSEFEDFITEIDESDN